MPSTDAGILHIYERWHATVVAGDLDGLMGLYANDATLETPLILATLPDKSEGILKGKVAIRPFLRGRLSQSCATSSRAGIASERSFPTAGN